MIEKVEDRTESAMKKFVSIVLALCVMMSCSGLAHAAESSAEQSGYWGYDGETVQIDEFVAEHYVMKSFYDGEIVYVITVLENSETEFAWAPVGGVVRSLTLNANNVVFSDDIGTMALLSNDTFVESVKDYCLSHVAESTVVYERVETVAIQNPESVEIDAMVEADYNALMAQMKDIHGSEHVLYNWTGMVSNIVGGLAFEYKENLDYEMNYRNSVAYSAGMTLGQLVAKVLSLIPQISVPMNVIARVLQVTAATNTILNATGQIASYYGSAVYNRFVLVEGGGPYFESFWVTDYDGWINVGDARSAVLVETGSYYNPTQELFENYVLQRERANENYNYYN